MITAPDLAPTRRRLLAYWIFTTIVVAESLAGGVADLLRLDPFFPLLTKLGYPAYLATILGIAKILGGLTVAAPRLPRLKEWAYAGILINMLGATASYSATRGSLSDYIPPLSFAAFALISWALRPPGRRLQATSPHLSPQARSIPTHPADRPPERTEKTGRPPRSGP